MEIEALSLTLNKQFDFLRETLEFPSCPKMAFSGTVQIGEIDDYIGPGAECTKPVEIQKPKPGQVTRRVRRKKGD